MFWFVLFLFAFIVFLELLAYFLVEFIKFPKNNNKNQQDDKLVVEPYPMYFDREEFKTKCLEEDLRWHFTLHDVEKFQEKYDL